MAKRKNNGDHHLWSIASNLHIKKNTAGTSNELSLSVLDGMKSQADAQKGGKAPKGLAGLLHPLASSGADAAPVETTPALPGSAPLALPEAKASKREARAQRARARALENPQEEILRRKKHRRVRRVILAATALISCAALAAFAVMGITKQMEEHQQTLSVLQEGFTELERADETILAADAVVTSAVSDASIEEINRIQGEIPQAEIHINAAESLARESASRLGESTDRKAADQLALSASSRRDMLSHAAKLMEADVNAKTAVDAVDACWELLVSADALMKEAAALVENTTEENTRASQAKTEEAQGLLAQATQELARAREVFGGADLSPLASYIEKRQEAIGYALASDAAIYVQDKATAEAQNDLYNQAEQQAAAIAADFPDDPTQPIVDAYEANTAAARENYLNARLLAGESDAFIRDYLSSDTQ